MGIQVVVCEDSLLMRAGIREILGLDSDIEIIAEGSDLAILRKTLSTHDIDVLLTDVRMPPTHSDEGIGMAIELRRTHPRIGVVVLSQYAEPAYAQALLEGGSARRAYLLKERISEIGELADAIRTVARGGSVIDPTVVDLLVSRSGRRTDSPLAGLTRRELEVLEQVAQGKSNVAVAGALFLTERGVERHINSVFAKLGLAVTTDVNRRVTAVLMHLADGGKV